MKPYQQYKASGISWIGEIPHHWSKLKLRSILKPVTVRNRTDLPLLSVVREKGVILRNIENKNENHNYIPDDLSNYKLVQKGQLAMNKMKAWQGSYGLSNYEGIVSPAYYVFSISGVFNYFFHLALRSKVYVPFFTSASDGVRVGQWDLNLNRMKEIPFYLPTNEEQQQIVRYIDWKTTKIHKFIKAKKKLIALLKEHKQKIIVEAVTKGINPDVHMMDSGVDWLGEIPEHWGVRKFSTLARIIRGASPRPSGDPKFFNGSFMPWVTVGEITKDNSPYLYATETCLTEDGVKKSQFINAGTLIYSNSGATLGVPKITKIDCCANDGVLAFTHLSNELVPIFAYYYLTSLTERIRKELRQGGTQPNLNTSIVKRFFCPLPPLKEQNLIVTYIEKEISVINKTIFQAEKEIVLIQEYQTRLISDVITGKIDVRSIQVPDYEPIEADIDLSDENVTDDLVIEDIEE
ncbi:TPA: restriction endonuclease subunit S [Legionella pneumophila]